MKMPAALFELKVAYFSSGRSFSCQTASLKPQCLYLRQSYGQAKHRVSIGEIELISTMRFPLSDALLQPCSASRTSSTCGVSGTMIKIMSDASMTLQAVSTLIAPGESNAFDAERQDATVTRAN